MCKAYRACSKLIKTTTCYYFLWFTIASSLCLVLCCQSIQCDADRYKFWMNNTREVRRHYLGGYLRHSFISYTGDRSSFFLIDRIIFDFIFLRFLLQRVIHTFRRPCNLNASIGKATDCIFFDRYIYPDCSCGAVCK